MVLVTGGAGLIGKELIDQLLAKGKKIRAIYNKNIPGITHPDLEKLQCSILDVCGLEEAMMGIEEVYHCAGYVSFLSESSGRLFKINVEGTANIVNAALEGGIKKLIHISSVASLGKMNSEKAITEDMQWIATANSKYGQSKYLGEMEVWRGIAEGLDAVIINPSIVLGPGHWDEGSTSIFKSAYNEFPWYTEGVKGFVDVRDVARAMIMLMESDVSGERFIISAENKIFKELFNKIALCFNKKPPARKASPFLASIVWRMQVLKEIFGGKKALLTRETVATAFAKNYYDNSKLLRFFPTFSYRQLDETISYTCNSLQQKVNNL
jgi:nucleoside-diphosphate-sugar epimerase